MEVLSGDHRLHLREYDHDPSRESILESSKLDIEPAELLILPKELLEPLRHLSTPLRRALFFKVCRLSFPLLWCRCHCNQPLLHDGHLQASTHCRQNSSSIELQKLVLDNVLPILCQQGTNLDRLRDSLVGMIGFDRKDGKLIRTHPRLTVSEQLPGCLQYLAQLPPIKNFALGITSADLRISEIEVGLLPVLEQISNRSEPFRLFRDKKISLEPVDTSMYCTSGIVWEDQTMPTIRVHGLPGTEVFLLVYPPDPDRPTFEDRDLRQQFEEINAWLLSKHEQSQPKVNFFSLPPEVRYQIYDELRPDDTKHMWVPIQDRNVPYWSEYPFTVCRRMRSELIHRLTTTATGIITCSWPFVRIDEVMRPARRNKDPVFWNLRRLRLVAPHILRICDGTECPDIIEKNCDVRQWTCLHHGIPKVQAVLRMAMQTFVLPHYDTAGTTTVEVVELGTLRLFGPWEEPPSDPLAVSETVRDYEIRTPRVTIQLRLCFNFDPEDWTAPAMQIRNALRTTLESVHAGMNGSVDVTWKEHMREAQLRGQLVKEYSFGVMGTMKDDRFGVDAFGDDSLFTLPVQRSDVRSWRDGDYREAFQLARRRSVECF